MVLADGWTTKETPQSWCQKEGRPHHPTWTPHPSLFELKETTFSYPRATRPFISIPLCLTFPLFPVSFLVWKLSRIRALVLVTITLVSWLYFYFFLSSTKKSKFVFSFKVQALEEFISWTRWKGLALGLLTFLYYRWRSIYLVTIKCFFFPKNLFGKTMRNGAWNEAGSGRDGMSRSLGRIFSLKNDERRMEVRDYLHVDLSSLMAI